MWLDPPPPPKLKTFNNISNQQRKHHSVVQNGVLGESILSSPPLKLTESWENLQGGRKMCRPFSRVWIASPYDITLHHRSGKEEAYKHKQFCPVTVWVRGVSRPGGQESMFMC